ncbi:MAG: biotin--[acetyl-CoA-carboxylase] ligase [Thermoanaerobaculia bacterium]
MEGAQEGFCVVADEQTAGRGRLERQWISPKGAGLYFSTVLRPRIEQKSFPLITLTASLAVRAVGGGPPPSSSRQPPTGNRQPIRRFHAKGSTRCTPSPHRTPHPRPGR